MSTCLVYMCICGVYAGQMSPHLRQLLRQLVALCPHLRQLVALCIFFYSISG